MSSQPPRPRLSASQGAAVRTPTNFIKKNKDMIIKLARQKHLATPMPADIRNKPRAVSQPAPRLVRSEELETNMAKLKLSTVKEETTGERTESSSRKKTPTGEFLTRVYGEDVGVVVTADIGAIREVQVRKSRENVHNTHTSPSANFSGINSPQSPEPRQLLIGLKGSTPKTENQGRKLVMVSAEKPKPALESNLGLSVDRNLTKTTGEGQAGDRSQEREPSIRGKTPSPVPTPGKSILKSRPSTVVKTPITNRQISVSEPIGTPTNVAVPDQVKINLFPEENPGGEKESTAKTMETEEAKTDLFPEGRGRPSLGQTYASSRKSLEASQSALEISTPKPTFSPSRHLIDTIPSDSRDPTPKWAAPDQAETPENQLISQAKSDENKAKEVSQMQEIHLFAPDTNESPMQIEANFPPSAPLETAETRKSLASSAENRSSLSRSRPSLLRPLSSRDSLGNHQDGETDASENDSESAVSKPSETERNLSPAEIDKGTPMSTPLVPSSANKENPPKFSTMATPVSKRKRFNGSLLTEFDVPLEALSECDVFYHSEIRSNSAKKRRKGTR